MPVFDPHAFRSILVRFGSGLGQQQDPRGVLTYPVTSNWPWFVRLSPSRTQPNDLQYTLILTVVNPRNQDPLITGSCLSFKVQQILAES